MTEVSDGLAAIGHDLAAPAIISDLPEWAQEFINDPDGMPEPLVPHESTLEWDYEDVICGDLFKSKSEAFRVGAMVAEARLEEAAR